MSTISPSSYQAVCSAAQASRKSPAATAAATSVNLRGGVTSVEQGEGDEGEEPRDVEVEPVREHELEADQDRTGERGDLKRRLRPREEVDGDSSEQDADLQSCLDGVEVGEAGMLVPVPDRERRRA